MKVLSSAVLLFAALAASEEIHLVNQLHANPTQPGDFAQSYVLYYGGNKNPTNNGLDAEFCVPHPGVIQWEGVPRGCTFKSGVVVEWSLDQNAQSQPNFARVGNLFNGFKNFRCFKNDRRPIGTGFISLYYCLP